MPRKVGNAAERDHIAPTRADPDRNMQQTHQSGHTADAAPDSERHLSLDIEHDVTGAPTAVRAAGGLDFVTVLAFREAAFGAVGARPRDLLLDLSDVHSCDLAGLSGLVAVVRVARMMGIGVRVAPAPDLRQTLESTGLSRQIPLAC